MQLQKISNIKERRSGFTIVELLIVIVVIGILAAITIIAYNGITNKANGTQARSNAETIQKVAEAYNADNGTYPTAGLLNAYSGSTTVPTSLTNSNILVTTNTGLQNGAICTAYASGDVNTPTAAPSCLNSTNGKTNILYISNAAATGACIGWYDFSGAVGTAGRIAWVFAGSASAPGTTTTPFKYSCT